MKKIILIALIVLSTGILEAKPRKTAKDESLKKGTTEKIEEILTRFCKRELRFSSVKVNSSAIQKKNRNIRITTSVEFSYFPFRTYSISQMKDSIREVIPSQYRQFSIELVTDGKTVEELIPLKYRPAETQTEVKKKGKKRSVTVIDPREARTFRNTSTGGALIKKELPYEISKGLNGRHIALWQSHGRYFKQIDNTWTWQRSLLWQTVEDLYTQSYVLPFLVPMLERAGANVLLPRERDFQRTEIISDNDPGTADVCRTSTRNGKKLWKMDSLGFAKKKEIYLQNDNPFQDGTSLVAETVKEGSDKPSSIIWRAIFPRTAEYAVYVSYRSFLNSASDAKYIITHSGQRTIVRVNQKMGGGTWIYLGTFLFQEGDQPNPVMLENTSSEDNTIVSADAVRFGGGMGNIARSACDSIRALLPKEGINFTPRTSGMPRYTEGSRYWLQWAGFSREVYSAKNGTEDYKDDYMSRGRWVNALMGGSHMLPDATGLKIPVDMALAFHTDAGITPDTTTIGTLGIFFTRENKGKFYGEDKNRYISRDLTDVIMTQIVGDIRSKFYSAWSRRGMWNKTYYEARVPAVPTMLLELLSHQNLEDMRYGLDPYFRFTVSRSIYKGILQHLATQYNVPYVVAPLPVRNFYIERINTSIIRLGWAATEDTLEPTAQPSSYVLYTRTDGEDWDSGKIIATNSTSLQIEQGKHYSFKVTAVNDGGESFDSEILSCCLSDKPLVQIVNCFDRVGSPECNETGFHNDEDSGVGYKREVAFIGEQRVTDPKERYNKTEIAAFGCSYNDHEGEIVGGNTFDYPLLYGKSLVKNGYSYISLSKGALLSKEYTLNPTLPAIAIFGKQRTTKLSRNEGEPEFKCFDDELINAMEEYLNNGGRLFLSGAYIASELFGSRFSSDETRNFAKSFLHIDWMGTDKKSGSVASCARASKWNLGDFSAGFNKEYREDIYTVNRVDGITGVGKDAITLAKYAGSRLGAFVGHRSNFITLTSGFPVEAVPDEKERDTILGKVMEFLTKKEAE